MANLLTRIHETKLLIESYELTNFKFEIYQPNKKSCVPRGSFEYRNLINLIENDVIQVTDESLECVIKQINSSLDVYIKELESQSTLQEN